MKKAQIMGQPLIMVFALIVGALILAWGVKVIFDIVNQAGCTELVKEIKDFEREIDNYYHFEPGSSKYLTLRFPKNVEEICFINPKEPFTITLEDDIFQSLMEDSSSNVFINPWRDVEQKCGLSNFKVPNIKINETTNPLCFKNNERAILITRTDFVEIKK